jgi:hypothetical protein
MKPDEKFLDGLLDILIQAPKTQIDQDIVADIQKFKKEPHTYFEKYDFIQNISREPMHMINSKIGIGRITPFVQLACDLDKAFGGAKLSADAETPKPVNNPMPLKDGEVIKYGWDGKPVVCKDESEQSKITVEYIIGNQADGCQERVLVEIFSYMDDLMYAGKFKVVDDFIFDFCNAKELICFQYYIALLTCACWAKDKLKNIEGLRFKAREAGYKEIGKKATEQCLKGLL